MMSVQETIKKRANAEWLLVGALVVIGAVVRVIVHDVVAYSPADEAHYVDITRWLSRDGLAAYPQFVSTYLQRETLWLSPTPLRWGYFSLTTLACSLHAPCDGRTIAWLSTIAGIVSLLFTYTLGRRIVGRGAAILATALTIVSPLQLALGRRALQDEVYTAAFLLAFWTLVRLFDSDPQHPTGPSWKRWTGFVVASTFAFSIKEAFVFPYVTFVLLYLLAHPFRKVTMRHVGLLLTPPLLFCAGFVALGKNLSALYEFARLHEASFASDYSIQYQSGPAHRPLFDLFLLAPIVCLLATGAVAKMTERLREGGRERWLAGFLIITLATFIGLPKNLRFVVILDPVLRLLAAWIVVNHPWFGRATRTGRAALVGTLLKINAVVEFSLFDTVFRQRNVYDPTTYDLLRALGAIPGTFLPSASNGWALASLLAFAGASAIVVGVWKAVMTEKNESAEASSRMRPPTLIAIGIMSLAGAFLAGRWSAHERPNLPEAVTLPSANVVGTNPPVVAVTNRDPMAEGLDALYAQKNPVKAVARFREVLASDPNHYGATYQLATALEQANDPAAARATWSKMATMAEGNRDEATLAQARARLAALAEPPPSAAGSPTDDPLAEPMRLGVAELYEKKNAPAAAKIFRDVLAKNPTHYGATFQLAAALEKMGKLDEAKPFWKKTLEMADAIKDTQTAAIARQHLGQTPTPVFGGFN
jgi:cytochrome c-type biogenesis protein CcmH/NrfG